MKKILLPCIVAAMFLFSCKKEHSSPANPSGKKYKVTFNVANFTQQQGGAFSVRHQNNLSSNLAISPAGYLDVLYCVVYDTDRRFLVKTIKQDSTMNDMGMITDSLPNGTYPVYFFAGGKDLVGSSLGFRIFGTYGYGSYNWQDTFWGAFSVTVNNGNVSQDVTLNRVVGKLELQILDNIPAQADSISISAYPEVLDQFVANGYSDGSQSPNGTSSVSRFIPVSAKGKPNFTIDKILTPLPFTVTITCKDASNNIIAIRVVDNIIIVKNTKTILSGNLFSGGNQQAFTAKLDTTWASNPTSYNW